MNMPWRWRGIIGRRLALVALAASLALPALAQAPAAPPERHGGGGFALLLLDYRQELERLTMDLRVRAAELRGGAGMAPAEMMAALGRVTAGASPILLVGELLMILGAGLLARHAVHRRLAGAPVAGPVPGHFGARLGRALYRGLVDLLALGAFAIVTIALVTAFVPPAGPVQTFILTYVTATLVVLGAALVARLLLAPDAPGARLLSLGDAVARFLYRWLVVLASVASFGWLSAALLILSGMQLDAHLILALAIGTLMALLLAVMLLQSRPLVRAALLGPRPRPPRRCASASPAAGMGSRSSISWWSGCSGRRAS